MSASRYQVGLATPADDAELRAILAATPMPGRVAVSFRREPSYFAAAEVEGDERQVVTGRDLQSGRLMGFGTRSLRTLFVNGEPRRVGYLSSLRLLPEHRNRGLIARGYAYFHELHQDGRAAIYLTTIADGNTTALRILTSARAGLPRYHAAGIYHTLLLVPHGRRRTTNLDVRPAAPDDVPEIVRFLNTTGRSRQFFPCYRSEDFFGDHGALRDLRPDDLLLARRGSELVGTLGAWDQSRFRQTVVEGYSGVLRTFGWLYDGWAKLRGRPPRPVVGENLRQRLAAIPMATDADAFAGLLEAVLARMAGRPAEYLLLGLHEADPFLPIASRHAVGEYRTHLFVVCWDDGEPVRRELDGRTPYLELGSL